MSFIREFLSLVQRATCGDGTEQGFYCSYLFYVWNIGAMAIVCYAFLVFYLLAPFRPNISALLIWGTMLTLYNIMVHVMKRRWKFHQALNRLTQRPETCNVTAEWEALGTYRGWK